MAVTLPELAPIDYTALDFDSIIDLLDTLVREHPDYFVNVDDFLQSNAGKFVVELVAYVVDLLANRIDWIANELTLPTATQKQNVINLLKLINYRMSLPTTASTTVTATISSWTSPFVIPPRYSIPAKDLDGNNITFELLNKNDDGEYIYESTGSNYEFDSGFEIAPILSHNDLVFYEGASYQEFHTMAGVNNEAVQLARTGVEEGSIRVWKITRDAQGNVLTKRELTQTASFISPEAQTASALNLPPYKIQITEEDGAYVVFGEAPVVAIFAQTGTEEIMIWYRVTKGSVGNITANSINYTTSIVAGGQNVQISFLNTTSASGGAESESIESAKRYAPLSITTVEKTVNPDDFVVLLERFSSLLKAIAYGKSNEPSEILTDWGYRIPPYETWIYSVYDKTGWENFPTYSYPMEMKIGRPYVEYGLLDTENIRFLAGDEEQILTKLKSYALDNDTANIKVTDIDNSTIYTAGTDYVIDLDGRTITRIDTGAIAEKSVVTVQYYQNDKMDEDYVVINFATDDEQDIPRPPIYTGIRTSAVLSNLNVDLTENTLSSNDYNWPVGDYRIDYETNKIIRNPVYPYLDSRISFGPSQTIIGGVNNEFIISFDGLNIDAYNSDHNFKIDAFNGWANIGTGLSISYTGAPTTYCFKISIDGASEREYEFTMVAPGTWTTSDLAREIMANAQEVGTADPFTNSGALVFGDSITYPSSPVLTFMSTTEGAASSIALASGTTYTDLFALVPNLNISTNYNTGSGELVDVIELAARCRATLNALGLCNAFEGQDLPASNEEFPAIYSKSDIASPSTFTMTGSVTDQLTFTLTGTTGGTYDVTRTITFSRVVAGSPYDLTTWQGRLDLISDMQSDIDDTVPNGGIGAQDVIEVVWLRQAGTYYRIGFRLVDTGSTLVAATIKMEDDNARSLLQFSTDQISTEGNLVEARVSPNSDLVGDYLLRLVLNGAFGPNAFIQCKANNALHNNTLDFLGLGDDQYRRGTNILQRTLIAEDDLIEDAPFQYTIVGSGASQNDRFNLNITSPPSGFGGDGNYVITIPAATYNINQLISAINTAFANADFSGTPYDISAFMICEKVEGRQRIRFRMTDFDSTATDPPDVSITDDDDATINKLCADKLGFSLDQTMSTYSTIILSYAGDWNSDYESDTSEATSIIKYLEDKRLISQDYIIRDAVFTTFDVKATVYVAKGFDRELVKEEVENNIFDSFRIDTRDFQQPVAVSNILKEASSVEGVEYTTVDYFGKDYQLYESYLDRSKHAILRAEDDKKAESVVARWNANSAFKITLDGCTVSNVNYDGEYLIIVGNTWTDRDYDDLLDHIQNGDAGVGGLKQAISLAYGGVVTDLTSAVHVRHYEGTFEIYTENQGPAVYIKLDDPDNVLTNGYQAFSRTSDPVLESEYTPSNTYSIRVDIDGAGAVNYEITSPTSGDWPLYTIAAQLDTALPSTVAIGIDHDGKIRITSRLGGNQSTIDISSGLTGINLESILAPIDTAVDGTSGYVTCLGDEETANSGTIYIEPGEAYGDETTPMTSEEFYNYKTTIESDYDEILSISDNFFIGGSTELSDQKHGIIFNYVEAGRND
jgi:hypothetical protein